MRSRVSVWLAATLLLGTPVLALGQSDPGCPTPEVSTIQITEPEAGRTVTAGELLRVRVNVPDDLQGKTVLVVTDVNRIAEIDKPPYVCDCDTAVWGPGEVSLRAFLMLDPPNSLVSEPVKIRVVAPPPKPVPPPVVVKEATPILLRTTQELESGEIAEGSEITFEVVHDVVGPSGEPMIAAGALARGKVTLSQRRGIAGKPGMLEFTVDSVTAVDGTAVPVEGAWQLSGKDSRAAMQWTLVSPILWFMSGKDTKLPADTELITYVYDDTAVGGSQPRPDGTTDRGATELPVPRGASVAVLPMANDLGRDTEEERNACSGGSEYIGQVLAERGFGLVDGWRIAEAIAELGLDLQDPAQRHKTTFQAVAEKTGAGVVVFAALREFRTYRRLGLKGNRVGKAMVEIRVYDAAAQTYRTRAVQPYFQGDRFWVMPWTKALEARTAAMQTAIVTALSEFLQSCAEDTPASARARELPNPASGLDGTEKVSRVAADDLVSCVNRGQLSADSYAGQAGMPGSIIVILTNKTGGRLNIKVTPGTVLIAGAQGGGRVIARQVVAARSAGGAESPADKIELGAYETKAFRVEAYTLEMGQAFPKADCRLRIGGVDRGAFALLTAASAEEAPSRVIQAAIWTKGGRTSVDEVSSSLSLSREDLELLHRMSIGTQN